jgi:1,4-dihydroxy-2-naphthoyl-CoA synthase
MPNMTQNLHPLLQRAETNGIHFEIQDAVALVRLSRPTKRNALSDSLVEALRDVFQNLPEEAKSAVIYGEGDHFCAGLDLSELKERDAGAGMHHSRSWHVALDAIQFGSVPVLAALHGAVVGGRHPRNFCWWRWLGKNPQTYRCGAHDRHDADWSGLQRH